MGYDTYQQECCEEIYYNTPEDDGYIAKDEVPDLDECRNAVADIIAMLYSDQELECSQLDDRIGYLAIEFGLKMPEDNPNVERPMTETQAMKKRLFQCFSAYTKTYTELTSRR